ncbi:MAG: hypothetical protein IKZ96_00015 [Bacilli bacterium]|nr:hypothetical protein [Bacilli bacterium]
MNKKLIAIMITLVVLILIGVTIILTYNSKEKFYLENSYYNKGGLKDITTKEIDKLIKDKKSFVLFTYNDFCSFSVPCDSVFEEASNKLNITILQIPYRDFKKTVLNKKIKYGPSVIIVKNGKVVKFLDAEKDDDKILYQDVKKFNAWLSKYIYTEKEKK